MTLRMELTAVTLDCADPLELVAFYERAMGRERHPESGAEFAALGAGDGLGIGIGFQRVAGYRAPRWPGQEVPQQFHFDFAVEDLDEAEEWLLGMGAGKPNEQPDAARWRVLTDPAGHPFCLVARGLPKDAEAEGGDGA